MMAVFFTVIMLTVYLTVLLKGKLFTGFRLELAEVEVKKYRDEEYEIESELGVKTLLFLVFYSIPLILIDVALVCVGLQHDPYLYPSLVMLTYLIFVVVTSLANKKKKPDLSTDEKVEKYLKKVKKKYTLRGTLVSLLWISYFVYLLYILIL